MCGVDVDEVLDGVVKLMREAAGLRRASEGKARSTTPAGSNLASFDKRKASLAPEAFILA